MIVRRSFFDTIINLYKPYIMDNCIKFVSKLQFLTFCSGVKIKKELNLSDLALSLSCLGRIRTLTGGTRIRSATITPPDKFVLRVQNCEFILGRPLRTLNFLFGLIFFYISILSMAMPIL